MSRSGYSDDSDDVLGAGRWRGRVASAIRGKRGQALLRELLAALDAMPDKKLAAGSLATAEGEFCTLGTVAAKHGIDAHRMPEDYWDENEWATIAQALNVSPVLVREIVYMNDEYVSDDQTWVRKEFCGPVRPYHPDWGQHVRSVIIDLPRDAVAVRRWRGMRKWLEANIKP